MREIKFRFYSKILQHYVIPDDQIREGVFKDDKMIVEQFTGLQDKSGRDIYEGDIDADGYVMTFEWGCFRFRKGRKSKIYTPYNTIGSEPEMTDWEVIGNIHENPELLG